MREYIKIETLFNRREDGSKKLIEGDFRNETVEFLKDLPWQFSEKIDGTNIQIRWDGHKVWYGGRTERASIPSHLMNKLIELFGSSDTEQLFEQKFGETEVVLYGEGYGPKIQNGDAYREDVSFILFDVLVGNVWLKRESVEDIARAFGIDVVPIVLTGTLSDAVAFVKTHPKSTMGTADMEGIVGRPTVELKDRMGKRLIVKVKVKDFE